MLSTKNLKHLNLCFTHHHESISPPLSPTSTTTSSHHHIHQTPPCSSSSPSTTSFMIKNFNSLYDPTLTFEPEPADFATACASQRFFFSSPGLSNSLIEYTNTSSSSSLRPQNKVVGGDGDDGGEEKKEEELFNGSVAVPTYSPDPYLDFRRSMQEMVEARPELMKDVKNNWNVLHELLLCYLALNPKSTHKFILGAFADLLVSLMPF